jgi:carbonic anhydrase
VEHLLSGIHQFHSQVFAREKEFFSQLADGQSPSALFVCCSDSRVDPNLILQADPGELFALRTAGNLIPPYGASNGGEESGIEYAVAVLGVKHIVVCGHSECGVMKAMLDPQSAEKLPAMRAWLQRAETTRRIIAENYSNVSGVDLLNAAIKENVLVQIENLQTHPVVAAALQRGDLTLHAWVYRLESGQILAFSSETERFEPLTSMAGAAGGKPKRTPGSVRQSNQKQ